MNHEELIKAVEGMLGFTVQERENDAVLVRTPVDSRSSVRPATREEVLMYLRLLGVVARMGELTDKLSAENSRLIEEGARTRLMGDALQAADARIKELLQANHDMGEERAFLAEVHRERTKAMQTKHDAGLIAAAERMQEEWLDKLQHQEERAESAEEMASQMHAGLSSAEEHIRGLKAEVASLQTELAKFEMVEGHG